MAHMDIFNADAFQTMELTAAVNKRPHLPSFLGSLGLFTPKPIRAKTATFEQKDGRLNLVQTSPRGAPLQPRTRDPRSLRYLEAPRIATCSTITASELAGLRAFGSESELVAVQAEVNTRLEELRSDVALTWENMRLGAVQGIVKDADGSTLYDLYSLFGVNQPEEVDFDLDNASPASGALRTKCTGVIRAAQRAAGDAWIEGQTFLYGLADDTFFDQFVAHPEYRAWQAATPAAAMLAGPTAFREIEFGGIRIRNYRGTDSATPAGKEVKVPTGTCKFFPVNAAPDLWQVVLTPGEFFDTINLPGQELYALVIPDRDRNAWAQVEMYSYPLFVNTRPLCLQRGRNT